MSRLSVVKNTCERHDVSGVIRKLFAHQATTASDLNPAALADRLTERVWAEKTDLLTGALGQTLHKLSIAAIALAHGYESLPDADPKRRATTIALSNVLAEIELGNYSLNSLDRQLIATATDRFAEMLEAFNETAMAES